ncbi:mucin-17-like [Gambusia affinis]|uniref:mucin-17-like n=1 Tax=Gambusia affinis TaxID=33528 RepID=UPI001CDD3C88|nr:mucin-17-like [Gambusia affinis]
MTKTPGLGMGITKRTLVVFVLLATLVALERRNFNFQFHFMVLDFLEPHDEHFLSHTREKRAVLSNSEIYSANILLNASNVGTYEQLLSSLNATSYPLQLDNTTELRDITVTTVCVSTDTGFRCECEEQFAWPYSSCITYGACDSISSGICKCISAIPADGSSCQLISELLDQFEYEFEVELDLTDAETVEFLRNFLNNGSFFTLNPTVNVTQINLTTVCSPISGDYQCRCEDQYRWPCDQCVTYGSCDNITGDTCGCISGIPVDGQYCQAEDQYNFTACPTTTTLTPTTPPVIYMYMVYVELNSTDVTAVEELRSINYPVNINKNLQISDVNISTVCSPMSGDYQCRCEDQYRWPCDQCVTYGSCDNITGDTCGCISGIPVDGQYCQAEDQYNFTACPTTTTLTPTTPPVIYMYMVYVELNSTDVTAVQELRSINYPVNINKNLQISDVNISTVCSPISGDYQCRCEDQYRWPCDQCVTYGSCDNIISDTCGCISGIPVDGQFCQAEDQYNFTACPTTTTLIPTTPPVIYRYMVYVELNSTDVTAVEELRSINYPVSISRTLQISDVNISTVCSPITGGYQCRCEDQYRWPCDQCVTYGSCDNMTGDTCGCISGIPVDGRYCQAEDQYNFTACPITTTTPQPTSPPVFHQYLLSIELNSTDVTVVEKLRNINNTISINRNLQISNVNITTVCSPMSGDYQCRCEDQYRWPCDQCVTYGSCDNITGDTCGCISGIPVDGRYCQAEDPYNFTACPITTTTLQPTSPPVFHQYLLSIELNSTDFTVVEKLRNINNTISINRNLQISNVNITTVCSPMSGDYQCRCEDQYRWPCDQCVTYGSCDNIIGDTCGCISGIPVDGQYCQAEDQYNFTACPITTTTPQPTSPPVFHQYLLSIELNSTDVTVVEKLRNINNTISINRNLRISNVNITTVCSPMSGDYQCKCEDQYRWPCDQCVTYGSCDNIISDTCGCISGIPVDGQYCQAEDQHNFTACPITTTTPQPTSPPVFHQYLLSIELNSTDVTVIEKLRNINNTISINRNLQISNVNITTVCSPMSGDYQCKCEDQYRWPCDQCVTYGSCDNIIGDTCGCISGIPVDGRYCQAEDQYNFTACPITTTTPQPTSPPVFHQYLLSIELNSTDVTVVEKLRNINNTISINRNLRISNVNITTVCSPISGDYQCKCEDQYRWPCDQCITYGSCDNITGDTCGCISGIPVDGQYCQAEDQYNFTACPITTTTPQTISPPVFHQYLLSIELNSTDVTVVEKLRNINNTISINRNLQISNVNITTVCSPISGDYQCKCEDQYRWPCDQCVAYGSCDNITGDTCGCISGIPVDGRYCQAEDQYNFTACPITTTTPQTISPPVFHQYLLSIELNSTDVTVVEKLRNINNTISINRNLQISNVNISTVCSPISGNYQCRCKNQYRWPCDQCVTYGSCDNITGDTCGCISGIPVDGRYCQAEDQYNFTACPRTSTTVIPATDTTSPEIRQYLLSFELKTTDVRAVEELRNITSSISFSSRLLISDINISTVCSPNNTSYQCRCEDQYGWPCDMCSTYGQCSNVQGNTCGCINALLPNNTYCQPLSDLGSCPTQSPTTAATTIDTTPGTTMPNTTPPETTMPDTTTPGTTMPDTTTPGTTMPETPTPGTTMPDTTTPGTTMPETPTPGTTMPDTTTPGTTMPETPTPGTTMPDTTTPGTTMPETPTPGTTMPDTTTPGTTMPETPTPGTTMPETPTPGTTKPDTTTPGTTMPDTTTPGSTMPETPTPRTTMPDATTPGTTSPRTTMPNTTTPGTTMLNTTPPETMMPDTTTPGTTMPDTTTPGTTMPETTPGTTMPETTPGTTMPETTPGTTMPDTTTPGTTMPNTTTPGTTMPDTTTPGITMADTTTPGTTMPNTTTPGATMPNTTTPGTTMPNTTTPGTTMPDTTTPGTTMPETTPGTMPNTTTPGTTMPDTMTPGTTMPNTTTPGTTMPNTTTPGTTMPNTTTPGTTMPDTTTPGTTMTNTTTPGTTMPDTTTPGTTMPETPTPGTTMPDTTAPGTTMPETPTPGTTMPETPTPGTTMPETPTPGTTMLDTTTPGTTMPDTTTPGTTMPDTTTLGTTMPDTTTPGTTMPDTTTPGTTMPDTTTPGTTKPDTTPVVSTIDIKRTIKLNKDFIEDYKNKSSSEYKKLEDQFNGLLSQQYSIRNGVSAAFVTDIRQGSVIVDFTIRTSSKYDDPQLAVANDKLINAIEKEIASVLEGKVPEVQSDTSLTLKPEVIYTDETMKLTCDPPGFDLSGGYKVKWEFKGLALSQSQRHIISSKFPFTLDIDKVILSDAGYYECTLEKYGIIVHQNKTVTFSNIKPAPVISVSGTEYAKCLKDNNLPLKCCVEPFFDLKWYAGSKQLQSDSTQNCITYQYPMGSCAEEKKEIFTCQVDSLERFKKETILTVFLGAIVCKDPIYGEGRENDIKEKNCEEGQTGTKTAVCLDRTWKPTKDTCIVTVIKDLLTEAVDLKNEEVPEFTVNLTNAVTGKVQQVTQSPATISAIVSILNTIAQVSNNIDENVMQNVLKTVDVIISDDAKDSWSTLNTNEAQNSSSLLLSSMETLSERLNGSFSITTQRIYLNRTKFTDPFNKLLNSTVTIAIPETASYNTFITTILFSSLNNVMPPRTSAYNFSLFNETSNETYPETVINAGVLLVKVNESIHNVTLSYQKLNTTLELNPQCVFWNFSLLDNLGAWDDQGCTFVSDINDTVTCTCNHLTSFSILMSTSIPKEIRVLLDIMTYIGVGISMISLVICLIIEGIVWRPLTKNSTAFMRHVAIVNTALSLLIADICFIIGAAISKNPKENPGEDYKVPVGPCSAATFFMHFFYLSMFFWMLDSSLLLLYRSVMVFSQMSKWTMFAIGLTVGYVCPLIIAVTTVAATAPGGGYVREDQACWLNWTKTKALLALVIPALAIVVFNILVILVVLYKMLRRRNTNQADEKHALVVILRCLAVLTPLFGLTWCLGIGTMVEPTNGGIHVAFAFFNSLQGFFILVFGTLFDSKIRSLILRKIPALSTTSNRTRSTSGGTSAPSSIFSRFRRRRNGYNSSPVGNSNTSSSGSDSASNT